MSLGISDEDLKSVRSGTALRFTVHFWLDEEKALGMSVKGFMAFRAADGSLDIKPPMMYLNLYGKRIKYYATALTPDASKAVADYIEDLWGPKITPDPDWNGERAVRKAKQKQLGWQEEVF